MGVYIIEKGMDEIELIRPLWEQLNLVHLEKSIYFKKKYKEFTFDKRMESIDKKAKDCNMKLDILFDSESGNYIGYCLSSIKEELGEIESIYIDRNYRKSGLGGKLMESALKWFESNNISNIQINVVYANDDALPFYERYGFHIGNYTLKKNNI